MKQHLKKSIILICGVSLFNSVISSAQIRSDSVFARWYFGVLGSTENNYTHYNNVDGTGLNGFVYKNISGQEYGDFIGYYLTSKISIRTGFLISRQTLGKEYPASGSYPATIDYTHVTYSEIPVLFSYNIIGHKLVLNTSDGLVLGFVNNFSTETIIGNDTIYNSAATVDTPSPMQEYIYASLCLRWSPVKSFNIAARSWGEYGLTKQYNFVKGSMISNGWSIEISYNLVKKE